MTVQFIWGFMCHFEMTSRSSVTLFVQQMHWKSLCMKVWHPFLRFRYIVLKGDYVSHFLHVYHDKVSGMTRTMRWIVAACFVASSVFPVMLIVTLKHFLRQNSNLNWDSLFYLQFISWSYLCAPVTSTPDLDPVVTLSLQLTKLKLQNWPCDNQKHQPVYLFF